MGARAGPLRCAAYAAQAWLGGSALYLLGLLLAGRRPNADAARVTSPMPATADQAAQQQLRWESGNAQLVRHELPGLLWHTVASGDLQGLGAAAELAAPSQTLMTAGAPMLLGGGLLAPDRRLAASSAATIAAQATYVLGGLAVAGGTGSDPRGACS